jgi:hypothetical protein
MTEPSDPVRIVNDEDNPIPTIGPEIDSSLALSGQITVTTAGTAVQGPNLWKMVSGFVHCLPTQVLDMLVMMEQVMLHLQMATN